MISVTLALQLTASATTILSSWAYGNKHTSGPILGLFSQIPWWSLMAYEGLWGLLPVNAVLTCIHVRNYLRWRKEKHVAPRS